MPPSTTAIAAGAITEVKLDSGHFPGSIVTGPDGNLWFTEGNGSIGRSTPGGTVTEYAAGLNAGSAPQNIIAGPDGNLWFTDPGDGEPAIGRITPSGTITEFSSGQNGDGDPVDVGSPGAIIAGPDGNVWFTDGSAIGRITPSGAITEFALDSGHGPGSLVVGPDGNLWFTDAAFLGPTMPVYIGRITTSGAITEFPLDPQTYGFPSDIVSGPDGNLWFTSHGGSQHSTIGRITPTGTIATFSSNFIANGDLEQIINGPDGNLWFTDWSIEFSGDDHHITAAIGRITPSGTITEFPTTDPDHRPPADLLAGPDGNLWLTFDEEHAISRFTTNGTVTNFSAGLIPGGEPSDITVGPGGSSLWFTDAMIDDNSGGIGRIEPVGPAGVSPQPSLTIENDGNGSGSVSSTPGGIDCGSTCSSQFDSGTAVTLTATAAPGSTFAGWDEDGFCPPDPLSCDWMTWEEGNACTGTAPCGLTLGGDATVSAVFRTNDSGGSGDGSGNPSGGDDPSPTPTPAPHPAPHKKPLKCRKGFKKKKVHGRTKCAKVKRKAHRHRKRAPAH